MRGILRAVRAPLAAAMVVAAAGVLSACSGPPASASQPPSPAPTRLGVPIGAVLATGTFPDDGDVHGSVEIVRGDGSWIVRFHDLTTSGPVLSDHPWLLASGPALPDGCPTQTSWSVDLAVDATEQDGEFVVPQAFLADPSFDDPTYIDGLGIRLPGTACGALRYAVAPLDWAIEPLQPMLNGADSGSRDGATGTTGDGVYTVAAGDTAAGIEARFGLGAGDLD